MQTPISKPIGETLLQEGKLDLARTILLEGGGKDPKLYPVAMRLLQELIARKDLDGALNVMKALFETSIQLHDEITLKVMLDAMLTLDESNIRTLGTLTTLLIRMNDQQSLEGYLKRLVITQLRAGELLDDHLELKMNLSRSTTDTDVVSRVVEHLRLLGQACLEYGKSWGEFPPSLAALKTMKAIDPNLCFDIRHGYRFTYTRRHSAHAFTVNADPFAPHLFGMPRFCIDESQVIKLQQAERGKHLSEMGAAR